MICVERRRFGPPFLLILSLEQFPDVQYFSERSCRLLFRGEDDDESEKAMAQKEVTGTLPLERFTPGVLSHRLPSLMGSKAFFYLMIVG